MDNNSLSPYFKTTPARNPRGHYGPPRVAGPMLVEAVTPDVTARAAIPEPHIASTVTKVVVGTALTALGIAAIRAFADYMIATTPRRRT